MLTEDYLKKSEIFQAIKHLNVTPEKFLQGIPQSENLEELCDEFIIVLETADGQKIYSINYNLCEALKDKDLIIKVVREKDLKYEFNIYGAVWCEFGLKYVAKMNSDGELVLI